MTAEYEEAEKERAEANKEFYDEVREHMKTVEIPDGLFDAPNDDVQPKQEKEKVVKGRKAIDHDSYIKRKTDPKYIESRRKAQKKYREKANSGYVAYKKNYNQERWKKMYTAMKAAEKLEQVLKILNGT